MVKPSRSDPEEDDQQDRDQWQQQSSSLQEASASAHSLHHRRHSTRKPSRSEPDEEHLGPGASPAERQMWRHQHILHLNVEPQEPATMPWVVAGDEYPEIDHGKETGKGGTKTGETGSFHNLSRPEMNVAHAPLKGTGNPAMTDDWHSAPSAVLAAPSPKPSRSESNVD